ncbi:MAG: chromate transporter [Filifactoraceae bacterium]
MLLELFLTFFKIGITSFGGGYAMIPMMRGEIVNKNAYMTLTEFTDIIGISQITPGPIAVNVATYIGYTVTNSILGAIVSTFGVILPSLLIGFALSYFFERLSGNKILDNGIKGLRLTVIGLIFSAGIMMVNKDNFIDETSILFFLGTLILNYFCKVGPIYTILLGGILGIFFYGNIF